MIGRPNPDELLRAVEEEERQQKRGKLTIFFGAAPGVGKTYSMLEAARSERDLKRDVVVGFVETHGRYDTGALVIGLELLPRKKIEHRGVVLEEFDLDGALARKPGLILVDELAHTNAPGTRHPKRWQDIDELLDAGIDVYTTVNVQHVESLNDVVAQITGVVVRETVPDSIFDQAIDVRLVDLPPDELIERLGEGKVYILDRAARAADSFFRKGNLIALRELALRRTAERVDEQMRSYQRAHGIERAWPAAERVLVCVSPSPESARLVRGARRMAAGLHAQWIAAYVETPASLRLTTADRERVAQNLRLSEQLGAETVTLAGDDAATEVLRYARSRNVTKVVVGKPTHPRWRDLVRRSFLEALVRGSHDIDVYVISGEGTEGPPSERPTRPRTRTGYVASLASVGLATLVAWTAFGPSRFPDVTMVYLLGVVLVAMRFGYGPSVVATVLSVVALDFFFVPPFLSFAVSDFEHVLTFGVMFVVAVVISHLTKRVRDQAEAARRREMRTAQLYAMNRKLAVSRSIDGLLRVGVEHVREAFGSDVVFLLPDAQGALAATAAGGNAELAEGNERGVAEWVWLRDKPAGLSTDTLPLSKALYLPLRGSRGRVGVMGVKPDEERRLIDQEQRQLLETFAGQIGSALERMRLAEEAQRAQVQVEAERLRSSLLSSVSHDLRTPLGVITGAASTLRDTESPLSTEAKRDLIETIHEEADRLNRLVRNLLDMTRLASGALNVEKEWQPLEEIVGAAINRVEDRLDDHDVQIHLPSDLPLVPLDAVLLEQVLINLLENAIKYTPPGTPIEISAIAEPGQVTVDVADRGPGIPEAERDAIFEKFYRLEGRTDRRGAGLGLAICRGVIQAHGGRIWVEDREGGGARFRFTLPIEGSPPILPGAS